jgi:predicted Zn-dependent protease with MMP-like domain
VGSSAELLSFEEHVRRALDELPPDLARHLENVAVVVEDEHAGEPDLFGLFEEVPYLPAKVTIYRRPLEEEFGHDPAELEHEIRITVLHELAHYFGIDEDRLDQLGYR